MHHMNYDIDMDVHEATSIMGWRRGIFLGHRCKDKQQVLNWDGPVKLILNVFCKTIYYKIVYAANLALLNFDRKRW